MKHSLFVPILSLGLACFLSACKDNAASQLPPPNVDVVEVIQQDVEIMEEFVGQTYGLFDIAIQARVDGFLEGMFFEEGRRVRKDQLLYTIEPEPYEAKVATARGHLAEAHTHLVKAESDLTRIRPLAEKNAVSQSDLDAAVAQRDAALAAVDAAEANLESARIELGFTKVYSPIDGVIGKTEVYPGDYVGRGINNVILNEVSRIDTILVNFHIPEEQYLEIARFLSQRDSAVLDQSQTEYGLTLILADGSVYPEKGRVRFINRQVNATTGTILLQAAFPNSNRLLRPGQFAKVRARMAEIPGALLVPQRSVQELQGNYNVFVVSEDKKVEFRTVEVAFIYQTGFMVISSGLSPGDQVVYEGLQKVKGGSIVNPTVREISISVTEN